MADGDNLVLGTPNTFDSQTFLYRSASGPTTAFAVGNRDGDAISGQSANDGATQRQRPVTTPNTRQRTTGAP